MSLYFSLTSYDIYLLDHLVHYLDDTFMQQSASHVLQDSRPYCLLTNEAWLAHSFQQVQDVQMAISYCQAP